MKSACLLKIGINVRLSSLSSSKPRSTERAGIRVVYLTMQQLVAYGVGGCSRLQLGGIDGVVFRTVLVLVELVLVEDLDFSCAYTAGLVFLV